MVKTAFVLCALAAFVQAISAQCIGYNNAANANNYGGCGYGAIASPCATGGNLGVNSASVVAPAGLTIVSENYIEGLLDVVGSLPLIASVALEGSLPSGGSVTTTYSCGNGNVGITADSLAAAGLGAGNAGANLAAANLGANLAAANYGANLAAANYGANLAAANYGANLAAANLNANYGANLAGAEIAALNAGARLVPTGCVAY